MFSGGTRTQAPDYFGQEKELRIRPYNNQLTQLTQNICTELGAGGNDVCLFETRTAFDCVLRKKVSKFGDITDNLGACKHHIQNMKQNLSQVSGVHPDYSKKLDSYLEELNFARKSFV